MVDDPISRQAAIDFIAAGHLVNPNEPRWSDNEVVNFLKSRPSAQRTGRWIVVDEQEPRRYGCSECKRLVWHIENYCPNCGARMEETDERT